MTENYKPQDSMSLWWLATQGDPRLIGDIFLVDGNRKVALKYHDTWLKTGSGGFSLSEDLPLHPEIFIPNERDTAAGAVDDARPDRWGERVIRLIDRPQRLSLLEYLFFAGDERFGAMGVSLSASSYTPCNRTPMPSFDGLPEMEIAIKKVLANEPMDEIYRRLIRPGASFGGARPKSLIQIENVQWVVKFSEGEEMDTAMVEHACMQLARRCGVRSAQTMALSVSKGHALAVCRFDRVQGRRLHVISANVALRAAGDALGYPELSQLLRRIGQPEQVKSQQEELFRRMVFNILMDNTDDHEKNHALIRSESGHYALSKAFDVVPSGQGLRYQQMRVGKDGAESSLDNAISEASAFGLTGSAPRVIVSEICREVSHWKESFLEVGVNQRDVAAIAQYIDGDYLRQQREGFAGIISMGNTPDQDDAAERDRQSQSQ